MSDLNGVIGLRSQWGRNDAAGISGSPKRDAVARLYLDKWTIDLFDEKRELFHRVIQYRIRRLSEERRELALIFLESCDTPKQTASGDQAPNVGEGNHSPVEVHMFKSKEEHVK
jgi:hypothetical protein